ncbi:MAG: ligand-binding sensor domain-containing protein, partial [Cyclobacteriaceae bacterium]
MPNLSISSVTQDKLGYLWVGTADGLMRYNGKSLLQFGRGDGLAESFVTAGHLTDTGLLYFGHYSGAISKFDGQHFNQVSGIGEARGQVKDIQEDDYGHLWLINNGLAKIDDDSLVMMELPEIESSVVNCFYVGKGGLFIGTNQGILFYKVSPQGNVTYQGTVKELEGIAVRTIYPQLSEEGLWIGTEEEGIFEMGYASDFKYFKAISVFQNAFFSREMVTSIYEDHENQLWVGTRLGGIVRIKFNRESHEPMVYVYHQEQTGFVSNFISVIVADKEQSIWMGTQNAGLVQIIDRNILYLDLKKNFNISQVRATEQNRDGAYIFGTNQGLIKVMYDQENKVFGEASFLLKGVDITGIFQDKNSQFWIGTADQGMYRANEELDVLRKYPMNPSIDHSKIRLVTGDRWGNLWISVSGYGAFKVDTTGALIDHVSTENGFIHNEIYSINCDSKDRVWFGTRRSGLAMRDAEGKLHFLTKDGDFISREINAILEDNSHRIWIATEGDGVFVYDEDGFRNFGTPMGMRSDYCKSILVDNVGNIWVGHSNGLSRIDDRTGIITTFGKNEGLVHTDMQLHAAFKDQYDHFWWGNSNGITRIAKPGENFKSIDLKTYFTDIRLFLRNENLLSSTATKADEDEILQLPHNENHITFDFIAISLKKQEGIYYQYKLDGYDKEWSPPLVDNSATYTNLDPGDYEFLVRPSDNKMVWDSETTNFKFSIAKPFWNQSWFYATEIIFFLLLVVITYYSGKSRHKWLPRVMMYVCI